MNRSWWFFVLLCTAARTETSLGSVTRVGGNPGELCTSRDGQVGHCEEIGDCLAEDGFFHGLLNSTTKEIRLCNHYKSRIYVCCRKPRLITQKLCRAWGPYWRPDGNCVLQRPLIFGGKEALLGEFPHVAAVGRYLPGSGHTRITWECGGSLITPQFVLTAAHCIQRGASPEDYVVRLGEHDTRDLSQNELPRRRGPVPRGLFPPWNPEEDEREYVPEKQTIRVLRLHQHPKYEKTYHDIGLLQLAIPAALTSRILPACLPFVVREDYSGKSFTAIGWGRTHQSLSPRTDVLQKVDLPAIDVLTCLHSFDGVVTITPDMVCAGAPGKDSCSGDSGGPLVTQDGPGHSCEYVVVGIVSVGVSCGEIGLYTRVASYLDWVLGIVAPAVIP